MKTAKSDTIEVQATKTTDETGQSSALVKVEQGSQALAKALTVDELHRNLEFIREVMRKEMKEGQDYGKIPGTGDKPTLLQPGAQKLLMTFNLTERVKTETLREYPNMHREYAMTVTVAAQNGKEWDGVGTCSTLESKYRYRVQNATCPKCGKETVRKGKKDKGGGYYCWSKLGGCGANFPEGTEGLEGGGKVEYENPPDYWNTARKMAFKRALVHASINATNTSDLWTQDLEEMVGNSEIAGAGSQRRENPSQTSQNAPGRSGGYQGSPPPAQSGGNQGSRNAPATPAKPATPEKPRFATEATRAWMLKELSQCEALAVEYFQALAEPAALLATEGLKDLPLEWIPISRDQMKALKDAIAAFGNGEPPVHPYKLNPVNGGAKPKTPPARAAAPTTSKPPPPASVAAAAAKNPEFFWDVFCPVPHKGQKKADYDQNPETIGDLYEATKNGDQAAQKRLFGMARNWQPAPREFNGKVYQPSEADHAYRAALDAFLDWEEKHHKDTAPGEITERDDDDLPM